MAPVVITGEVSLIVVSSVGRTPESVQELWGKREARSEREKKTRLPSQEVGASHSHGVLFLSGDLR